MWAFSLKNDTYRKRTSYQDFSVDKCKFSDGPHAKEGPLFQFLNSCVCFTITRNNKWF